MCKADRARMLGDWMGYIIDDKPTNLVYCVADHKECGPLKQNYLICPAHVAKLVQVRLQALDVGDERVHDGGPSLQPPPEKGRRIITYHARCTGYGVPRARSCQELAGVGKASLTLYNVSSQMDVLKHDKGTAPDLASIILTRPANTCTHTQDGRVEKPAYR